MHINAPRIFDYFFYDWFGAISLRKNSFGFIEQFFVGFHPQYVWWMYLRDKFGILEEEKNMCKLLRAA